MKQILFSLLLLFACHSIFAQKNFYGAGASYSFAQIREDLIGLKSLSLNYERKFSPKWSYSIVVIGQKSPSIEKITNISSDKDPVGISIPISTTHRLFGVEPLLLYHPKGVEEGVYFGLGINAKIYDSKLSSTVQNIPQDYLSGTINIVERSAVLTLGYNEQFDNGFRFNPFLNFALSSDEYNEIPIEFRLGCNFMFGGNIFKGQNKK